MTTTQQIYLLPQVAIDSVKSTWNSQTIYWKCKTGNDTLHVLVKSAKNSTFTIGLNLLPEFTLSADTGWKYQISTITDLQDSVLYYNQVTVTNRKGSVSVTDLSYTLARPVNTPFASSDSSTVTYTSGTVYGSGWGNGNYGFKVYATQADALNDNNGANYIGSGSISSFTKTITGLNANTKKWWRSYVINNGTTVWGGIKSFTTKTVQQPTVAPTVVPTSPTTASGNVFINTNGHVAKVLLQFPAGGFSTLSNGVALNGNLPVSMTRLTPDDINYYSIIVIMYGDTIEKIFWVQTPAEVHAFDAAVLNTTLNTVTDELEVYFRYVSELDPAQVWIEVTDDISGTPVVKWTSPYATVQTPDGNWDYGTINVGRTGGWKANPATYYTRLRGYNSNNPITTQWVSTVVVGVVERTNQKEFFRLNSIPIYLNNTINDEVILDMYSTNGQQLLSEKNKRE
jgi:hypothetical protein